MKNNRGFTLVELLVAVVLFGIIIGMSFPVVRNVRSNNEKKKFDAYGQSMLSGARLYCDSYEEDLFGHHDSGCALVSYSDLKEKGLIKDFPDSKISCNDENTLVRVVKLGKQYGYSYQLYCGNLEENGTVTNVEFKSSSFSKTVDSSLKKDVGDIDDDNDGFKDETCNLVSNISISASPDKDLSKEEYHAFSVSVVSNTGFLLGSGIEYTWIDADDIAGNTTVNFDTITNWKKWTFKLESEEKQREQLFEGTGASIVTSKNFMTPIATPKFYLLVLKMSNVRDLAGDVWKETGNDTKYKVFGVYNTVKKYHLKYNSMGGSSCSDKSVIHEKNGSEKWGTLCTPTRTGYTFEGWYTEQDGAGTQITANTVATSDLTVYAKWKIHTCSITFSPNGGSFGNNANNTVQKLNYGGRVDDLWNANGGTYSASRSGYSIDASTAWILSGGTKTFDETKGYNATDFCSNLGSGDQSVTLNVNWKMASPSTPSISNSNHDKWVSGDYNITVSTTSPSDIIGKWYYSTNNSNYSEFSGQDGKSSFTTSVSTSNGTARNNTLYVKVCNKDGVCSSPASTIVKIDKAKPVIAGYNMHSTLANSIMTGSQCPGSTRKTGH